MPTDPQKRNRTRYRGVSYRVRADGSRRYYVFAQGRQWPVDGGEREALDLQAQLRGRTARGEQLPKRHATFGVLAEEWLASKVGLRDRTRSEYAADLYRVLLPRFGARRIERVTADEVAVLIRDLSDKGLSAARIDNILKPLSGTLKLAIRRGHITTNPLSLLTTDERPQLTCSPPVLTG